MVILIDIFLAGSVLQGQGKQVRFGEKYFMSHYLVIMINIIFMIIIIMINIMIMVIMIIVIIINFMIIIIMINIMMFSMRGMRGSRGSYTPRGGGVATSQQAPSGLVISNVSTTY